MKILLENCNIIPISTDGVVNNIDVLIENGIIMDICPTGKKEYNVTQVVDCSGKFVMPGMMDAHIHTTFGDEQALGLMVACGITTVRNMWGNQSIDLNTPELDTHQMALDFTSKKKFGPTLVNTSRIWDGVETVQVASRSVPLPYAVRIFMNEAEEEGADQIKVYENIDYDVFDSIIELAKEREFKVVGHIPQKVNKRQFMNKAWSLEHGGRLEPSDIDYMATTSLKWVPTIITVNAMLAIIDGKPEGAITPEYADYVSKTSNNIWEMSKGMIKNMPADAPSLKLFEEGRALKDMVKRYYELGSEVATGTDYPNPYCYPGFGVHMEMQFIGECGATNQQVLRAATINAAKVLELNDRKGTIEIGKDADLVVLNKNPLEDTKNTLLIDKVVLLGEVLDREKLDQIMQKSKES